LTVIGHGIDTELFTPAEVGLEKKDSPIILCVGRLSPVKDHLTLLRAAKLLKQSSSQPFRVVIVGNPATSRDQAYSRSLYERVGEMGLGDIVCFESAVATERLPAWYRRCAVHVNLSPLGGADKVAWEAMACGRPCLVANQGFQETLGQYADRLIFPYRSAEELAERLKWALSLTGQERAHIGACLRQEVVARHSLSRLAESLINLFESDMISGGALLRRRNSEEALKTENV
jgi:glycosyltransferase involved in cell wall biosynthesis